MVFWSYCQLTSKPKSYEVAESPHVVLPPMGIKACIVQNLRYATFDYPQQRITKMEKENFCVGRIAVKGALRPWSVKDYPLIICTC